MLQGVDRQFVARRQEKSHNAVRSGRTWTCILRMGTMIQNNKWLSFRIRGLAARFRKIRRKVF